MGEGPEMDNSVHMTWFYCNLTCVLLSCFLLLIKTNKTFIYCFIFFLGLKAGHKHTISGQLMRKTWMILSNDAEKAF